MDTRHKILDKALEMFNERGIEYVGLRELASLLDMRVSNITYYFPTKDDLVYEISEMLRQENSKLMIAHKELTMTGFLEILNSVFHNHIKFRCLLLSVVHIMQQNKHLAAGYNKTQTKRNASVQSNLQALQRGGYLKLETEEDAAFLVSGISLISRFWISEASISDRKQTTEQQIVYYLKMIRKLMLPYATAKGKKEIMSFTPASLLAA